MVELTIRDGFAMERARNCLAHAIAIVTDDYAEAKKLAQETFEDAFSAALQSGLRGGPLSLAVIARLDASRDRLPV